MRPFNTFYIVMAVLFIVAYANGAEPLGELFQQHCVACHGSGDAAEAGVDLDSLKTAQHLSAKPRLLEKLIGVLVDEEMPPEGEDPLPDADRTQAIASLRRILHDVQRTIPFEPTPLRRMNRFQYNNAVVDLLELDRDIFQLNERLLRRREDYFHPHTKKMPDQVRISCRPLSKDIDNQRPEGFRGVAAFPQDQRAEHGFDNRADHISLSPLLMESFLQLSQTIVESPDLNPNECRCWDRLFSPPGQRARGPKQGRYEGENPGMMKIVGSPQNVGRQDLNQPGYQWSEGAHLFWRCKKEGEHLALDFDVRQSAKGLFFRLTRAPDYGVFRITLDDHVIVDSIDLYDMRITTIDRTVSDLKLGPGRHRIDFHCLGKAEVSKRHYFGVDFVELTGLETTDDNREVPPNAVAIRQRLRWFLRRAFRRPVDAEVVETFAAIAEKHISDGGSFDNAMRNVVGVLLGMPDFLYLYETAGEDSGRTEADGRTPINDFELASRLSQFFWSSVPDDELLDLAETGELHTPEVLGRQIDRMMNDQRSARFCDNFPGQWLQLDRLVTAIPDRQKYPWFYYAGYRSSMHMMSEPLLLFETVFVEDRSVLELLNPDFTWQSDMLSANYQGKRGGATDVQVQTFKRVSLDDPRRGGVITNAAVMTMTSTPTRTQPITRGAWVNAVIFNDPPEPPPADVPPLPETEKEELAKLTIRERLAHHRQRADCAGCHNRIDPLGFALENYDPTGVWRDKYENGRDVDVSGVLFNRHAFNTVFEFKQLILQQKQRFLRAFAAHLLSYALGRELGPADSPALDEIAKRATDGEDKMRSVLKQIAMSEPFLHKNVLSR